SEMPFRPSLAHGVGLALLASTRVFSSCSAEDTNLFEETSNDPASGGTTGTASTTGMTLSGAGGSTSGLTTTSGGSGGLGATTGGAASTATGTNAGNGGSAGGNGDTGSGGSATVTCEDTELLCDGACVDVEENDERCGDC